MQRSQYPFVRDNGTDAMSFGRCAHGRPLADDKGMMNETRKSLRWWMATFVFTATLINYLDRQTLSVAAPILRERFHMSNVGYSRVVFAFLLAYTVMNGLAGPMIDRLGTRIGYAVCIAWWSMASILHAFARGAVSLGILRFLLGMGEAGNWPAGVKVVSEWFPDDERSVAAGYFNSGSAAGAILAPPVVAWLLLRFGWQWAFVATGGAGLIWLALWLLFYRTPKDAHAAVRLPRIPVPILLRNQFVLAFTLAKVFIDPVWYFYIFWFPEYLKTARHFSMSQIGSFAWIPFLVAGAGNFLGGSLSALLIRRGVTITLARKTAASTFIAMMLFAIPAVLVPSPFLSIGFVSVAMMGYTGTLANMLAMPTDIFPSNSVASVYGIASMGSGFGGMIATLATGWAVDHLSYTPVFIAFGVLPLLGAAVMWALLSPHLSSPQPLGETI